MWRIFAGLAMLLGACAPVNYNSVARGEFSGLVKLYWVEGGRGDLLGDGQFLYVPDDYDPLVFTRNKANAPSGDSDVIAPEAFYTDGGSVPRAVQSIPGFNAWGFGPAYIVHDWVFVARKCMNYDAENGESNATKEMRKISEMTFRESAQLMGEGIKALLSDGEDDDAGGVITSVTAGPVSHRLWREAIKCSEMAPGPNDPVLARIQSQRKSAGFRISEPTEFTLEDGRKVRLLNTFNIP